MVELTCVNTTMICPTHDADVNMATLRRIFTEKECTVERLSGEFDLNQTSEYTDNLSKMLFHLKSELVELMQRSVNLWRHLSAIDLLIQSIKDESRYSQDTASNISLLDISNYKPDDSVASWLEDSNFDSAETSGIETCEEYDENKTDETDVVNESSIHVGKEVIKDIEEISEKDKKGKLSIDCEDETMRLLQLRERQSHGYKESSTWLKLTYRIPSNFLTSTSFQSRVSLTNIAKWRNCPFVVDIDSISKDLFGKTSLPSSLRQIVPRRRLHRQDCIYSSLDSLVSLSEKSQAAVKASNLISSAGRLTELAKPHAENEHENDSGVSDNGEDVSGHQDELITALSDDVNNKEENSTERIEELVDELFVETEGEATYVNEESTLSCGTSENNEVAKYCDESVDSAIDATEIVNTEFDCDISPTDSPRDDINAFDDSFEDDTDAEVEFSFLLFRDGYVTCRIMTPTIEHNTHSTRGNTPDSDWEELQFLNIVDGKACFASILEQHAISDAFTDEDTFDIARLFDIGDDFMNSDDNSAESDVETLCGEEETECVKDTTCDNKQLPGVCSVVDSDAKALTLDIGFIHTEKANPDMNVITTNECVAGNVFGDDKRDVCSLRVSSLDSGLGDELTESFDKSD